MAQQIEPFHRVSSDTSERVRWPALTVRVMQAHLTLFGLVLLLGAAGLFVYLYSLELTRVDITPGLRITRAGEIYEQEFQLQVIAGLVLLGVSVFQLQVVRLLAQRRRSGLWLGRVSAAMLLAGLPAGVGLWLLPGATNTEDGGLVAQAIDELALVVRIISALLVVQALLALWYIVASFLAPMRRLCRRHTVLGNPLLRRAQILGITVWGVVLAGLGITLGVFTDWVYEVPAPVPEPGALLYATTFDDFNEEWDLYPGRDSAQIKPARDLVAEYDLTPNAAVYGDALVVAYGAGVSDEVIWSTLDRTVSDFDLRVTARLIDGPIDQNQFGVIFRYRDPQNFYIFRITADGYYALVKVRDGVQETISDWGITDVIRQGHEPNSIRVVGKGDTFTFFINDTLVPLCMKGENETSMWANWEGPGICYTDELRFAYRDGTFHQGRIALAAGTIDGSDVTVAFDDLVIVGPDLDIAAMNGTTSNNIDDIETG